MRGPTKPWDRKAAGGVRYDGSSSSLPRNGEVRSQIIGYTKATKTARKGKKSKHYTGGGF